MQPRRLSLAHELDAAWIIALWKAIHGGDPSPIEVDARSVELVEELAGHLARTIGQGTQALTQETFQARLGEMGIQLERQGSGAAAPHTDALNVARPGSPEGQPREPLPYCFVFRGTTYCVHFPRPLFTLE